MKNSLQKLVISQMQRDTTPRTTAELAEVIAESASFKPTISGVSVVMQTLRNHPAYNLVTSGKYPRQKYSLGSAVSEGVDLHALVRLEFETRLWAVRAARGRYDF